MSLLLIAYTLVDETWSGQNAGIYSSEPRAKTEKALAAIHGYLKQFSLAMLSLSVYWGSAHIPNLSDEKWKDEPGAPLSVWI